MPDIQQLTSDLRGIPDQALQNELQHPSGLVPGYLVLAEAQRRQLTRQAAQKQQQGQSGSVLDDVMRSMMAGQPPQDLPPAPVGMTPPRQQQQPMPGSSPPQQMGLARGGAIRFDDGGDVEDDDTEDDVPDIPDQPSEGSSRGEANRAMQPVNVDDLAEAMIQFEGSRLPSSPGFHANNPGHLMFAGQNGSIGKDAAGFARFNNWNTGLAAMKDQIRRNLSRGLTLQEMIGGKKGVYAGWAPAFSGGKRINNTEAYIKYISGKTGYDPTLLMQEGAPLAPQGSPIRQPVLAAPPSVTMPSLHGPDTGTEADVQTGAPGSADTGTTTETPTETPTPPPTEEQDDEETPEEKLAFGEDDSEDEGDGKDGTPPATPAKTLPASYVMPGSNAQPFNPYSPENIKQTRGLYSTLFGGSPERQKQLDAERAVTISQLQGLRQEAIDRYHNPSPWEFLGSIAAGMGASKGLSLPMMFAQGVGNAWKVRDTQQDHALAQAEALTQRIDQIQGTQQSEAERQGRDLITMLGQQNRGPAGQAAGVRTSFRKFVDMGAPYGAMDPSQAPGPGMIGIPDPDRPGFGVWVPQGQSLKQPASQHPTGTFEKDWLPGWAEENNTTVDKLTGAQRKQALDEYQQWHRASMVNPDIKDAANEIAQGIIDGTQPPDMKGLYRYGGQVRAILAQKGYNLTTAMRDWQNLNSFYKTLNGATQLRMRQSTQFVADSIPYMRQLYQDWQATGLPTGFKEYNKAALVAAANLPGDPGVKARLLLSQLSHMTSEVGTMYKGGNNSTDESLKLAGQSLQADWNPEQFMAALGQLEKNVQIRRNSWNSISPVGVSPNSPYLAPSGGGEGGGGGAPAGGGGGLPPGALDDLKPGYTRTFGNGQKWRKKADGSVEQVK